MHREKSLVTTPRKVSTSRRARFQEETLVVLVSPFPMVIVNKYLWTGQKKVEGKLAGRKHFKSEQTSQKSYKKNFLLKIITFQPHATTEILSF